MVVNSQVIGRKTPCSDS